MTVLTLGEAAARAFAGVRPRKAARSGGEHRTGAPVRRDSVEAGTFEDLFFAAPAKGETDQLLRTARAALDTGRRLKRAARSEARDLSAAERAVAALTAGAVRVYEELLTLARLNRGRVYPSYDHLAEATALGRATVARALRALEQAGFLVRQRRFKRVEGEGPGPRWEQTSNAYRPTLPRRILGLLPRRFRPAPLPDDAAARESDRQQEVATMLASLSCREFATTTASGALGSALARLGAAIDGFEAVASCESQSYPEPHLKFTKQDIQTPWPSPPTNPA
jgi:DNA-binding transcriptional ArsR family regulator